MKLVFAVFRVMFLFAVFFVLGLFLVLMVLKSWPAVSQLFLAIAFATLCTWWFERRRRKRLLFADGKPKRMRQKAQNARGTSAKRSEISVRALQGGRQSYSSQEPRNGELQFSDNPRIDNVNNAETEYVEVPEPLIRTGDRDHSLALEFSNKQSSGWIPAAGIVTVAGQDIGGLIYVGTPPRINSGYQDKCRAYIDPSLSVAKVGSDVAGDGLSYWPSYTEMSPQCRAAYLDWLATGRCDVAYSPGYMFLYFYGLERRFFVEGPNVDSNDIIVEVSRLRKLYAESRSAQRYLGEFLDVASISGHGPPSNSPCLDSQGWEVPFSIKYAIGAKLSRSENLDSDWLLAWFVSHPERNLRTPADRCQNEFYALFKLKFDARFQNGLKVNKPRKQLKIKYSAASNEFQIEIEPNIDGKPVPDISGLRKPIETAQEIADEAMNDLDKLSRYLGRNKDGLGSLEAHALLPQELWSIFPSESLNQLESWTRSIVEEGGVVPVLDVVERLEGVRSIKLTKRNLTGAADALARIGFGMAPDPRFALRSPKIEEPVVIFELGESVGELESVSAQYRVALIETAVRSFVVHADGQVNEKERTALLDRVRNVEGLTPPEQRRLEANLNWMLIVPPDLSLLRRKLKESTPERIASLRVALVSASYSDGVVQSEEVAGIEKIYKTLGLDPSLVYSDLHAGDVQDGPVQVRAAELAVPGEPIPPESISGLPQLDASRIAEIKLDTERVSSVLGDIFTEEPDSTAEDDTQQSLLEGLDEKHTKLVQRLVTKEAWTEDEVQGFCSELGLMPSGAIETVNEWAFEVYDEALIDEYEGFEVAAEPASLIQKKFVEGVVDE